MKIRSLKLEHFKKFAAPVVLKDIKDGLNILAKPNEEGKSTLLDALRAVLFERYSSKSRSIKELQTSGNQTSPEVDLEFEMENGIYRISKRFLKKEHACLTCPDGRVMHDEEAEDELRGLLRFSEPGRGGASDESLGMWSVLWVRQGDSFDLNLGPSAQKHLHNALDAEVSDILGGSRGQLIPESLRRQLHELVTEKTHKPKGRYRQLVEEIGERERRIGELEERRDGFSRTLDDLEAAQNEQAAFSSPARERQDREELEAVRRQLAEAEKLEATIDAEAKELELLRLSRKEAGEQRSERERLRREMGEAEKRERETAQDIQAAQSRLEEAGRLHSEWSERCKLAEERARKAEGDRLRQQRIAQAVQLAARIAKLERVRQSARKAQERRDRSQELADAIGITDRLLQDVRKASSNLDRIEGQLEASATGIRFDLQPGRKEGVILDGEPLASDSQSFQAIDSTTIHIPDRGRIHIDPSVSDQDQQRRKRDKARQDLERALDQAGVSSPSEAEALSSRRQGHLNEVRLAKREIEIHEAGLDYDRSEHPSLEACLKHQASLLKRRMKELGLQEVPEEAEAERLSREAEREACEAASLLEQERASRTGPEDQLQRCRNDLAALKERSSGHGERLDSIRRKLEQEESASSDGKLLRRIQEADEAIVRQKASLADLEGRRREATAEQHRIRIGRKEEAIEGRRKRLEDLKVRIASLKSAIQASEGVGIEEQLNQERQLLESRKSQRSGCEREVEVLKLLLGELAKAEKQAKEKYLKPIADCVQPYFDILFPFASLELDEEDLRIRCLTRKDGPEEEYGILSMGTKEQIAILFRLAFAELLVKQGLPATVVLDDALVYSDDFRIKLMFDILHMASQRMQIIVLTCRNQLFADLGGHSLHLDSPADRQSIPPEKEVPGETE